MNINRNNYEEYFLLYADNELTATERKVVEIFLQENVDLKEEFLMIQMTINSPEEEMKILDKSFLLKTEPSFINENNYEEVFVLYYDNELSEEEKKATEKFVSEDDKFHNEFELIGTAKFGFEPTIIYPNKKELYRKSGKILPLVFWRSMAAAVFIGFGLWIAISYSNKNDVHQPIATTVKTRMERPGIKESAPGSVVKENSQNKEQNVASATQSKQPEDINATESDNSNLAAAGEKINKKSIAKTEIKVAPKEVKINVVKPKIDFQLASNEPIKEVPENIEKKENFLESNTSTKQESGIDTDVSTQKYAHTASYISDADQKNDNYVFYDVSAEEFRKSKVGGFLKKVKRIVERTNPIARLLGDEEQLVAK